jgi:hypothetical protein
VETSTGAGAHLLTVLGNKASSGNNWHDLAVPDSDQLTELAIRQLDLAAFGT